MTATDKQLNILFIQSWSRSECDNHFCNQQKQKLLHVSDSMQWQSQVNYTDCQRVK